MPQDGIARDDGRMSVRIVRLGTPRLRGEGTRIGTVRRPPRGVPRARFATDDWYDVWFPNLSPSLQTMKLALGAKTASDWAAFVKKFRHEMNEPGARHDLDVLATLSHATSFSVGCYCENEARCHRSVLRQLLAERGADIR